MTKIKTRVAEFFSGTHEQLMNLLGGSKEVETEDFNNYTVYVGPDDSRQLLTAFPNSQSGTISLDNNINISLVNFDGISELQFLPMGDVKSGGIIDINSNRITVENITGKWTLEK